MSALATEPLLPLGALLLGLAGGVHCIGMCGPLVMASAKTKVQIASYQIGRLLGYSLLALIATLLGQGLLQLAPYFSLVGTILIALLFITFGIRSWQNKGSDFQAPLWLQRFLQNIWRVHFNLKTWPFLKSFLTGMLSLLLPCGLLYSALFGLILITNPSNLWLGLFAFWLGTLPAMVFAPQLIQKILKPWQKSSPQIIALFFISLGLLTLILRLWPWLAGQGIESCCQ